MGGGYRRCFWQWMSFGRDNRVVPSNIVLDRGPSPLWEGEICESEPPVPPIAKLLWPMFGLVYCVEISTYWRYLCKITESFCDDWLL